MRLSIPLVRTMHLLCQPSTPSVDVTLCTASLESKKTALETWNSFPQTTPIFIALSSFPTWIHHDWMQVLERYVVLLYDRTSSCLTVDEAREQLFTRKSRRFDSIPPTRDPLLQHAKRTTYQAGHIWGQALIASPLVPSS